MIHFVTAADTDVGIVKSINQDSVLMKHASSRVGEVLMAVICDGMGGLYKGELASASLTLGFAKWFDEELPAELQHLDMNRISRKLVFLVRDWNDRILAHGRELGVRLGTTCSAILFVGNRYVIVHVGDTRVYHAGVHLRQLTEDQTFVAREIREGRMTLKQAGEDKRRSLLLQCVGASGTVEPQVICGNTARGMYMICSDGLWHEISAEELHTVLRSFPSGNKSRIREQARYLIDQVKDRQETDNISVVLIQAV